MLTKGHRLLHQPKARLRVGFFCRTLSTAVAWLRRREARGAGRSLMLLGLCSGPRAAELGGRVDSLAFELLCAASMATASHAAG